MFGLGLLFLVMGNLNTSEGQDILKSVMPQTLCQHFAKSPFLLQCDCATVHKATSRRAWFGVEDWPTLNPDHNPVEHLYDEKEKRSKPKPLPTSVSDLLNVPHTN